MSEYTQIAAYHHRVPARLRKDWQLTIREITSTRPGAGQEMLKRLCATREGGELAFLGAIDDYERARNG